MEILKIYQEINPHFFQNFFDKNVDNLPNDLIYIKFGNFFNRK